MDKKRDVYERIKNSTTFADAELFIKIIKYLIDADEKGHKPSSAEIAYDILGNDTNQYKDQVSFMRVQIYHLRKKLAIYYLKEGKTDPYHLSISKGSYQLTFKEVKTTTEKKVEKTNNTLIKILSTIILVLIVLLLLPFITPTSSKTPLSSLIVDMTKHEQPLAIVVGNRDFYKEFDPLLDRNRFIWDTDNRLPHNKDLMSRIIRRYPNKQIRTFTGSDKMTHIEVAHMMLANKISKELTKINKDSEIKLSSHIKEVKQNMLFISKMGDGDMYLLKEYFKSNRFIFNDSKDTNILGIKLNHFRKNDSSYVHINPKGGKKHYFILKKTKLYNGNVIFYLISNQHFVRDYVYTKLFDPSFTEEVLEAIGKDESDSFEVLLEMNMNEKTHRLLYASADD